MYMNDFWGGLKLPEEKYNPIEKLHFMACKQILGVQKQTTNIGVLLELGRVPLKNNKSSYQKLGTHTNWKNK